MTTAQLDTPATPLMTIRLPSKAQAVRLALRCFLLLLAANGLFLAVRLADNLVPKAAVAASLRAGYADGSMTVQSYPTNMLVGRDQYSDCIAAQLAVLGGTDVASDAVAPRLLSPEQVGADLKPVRQYPCAALKTYVEGGYHAVPSATYTRFWQGSASVLAVALAIMPVDAYRGLLLLGGLGLIVLTAMLAALADRRLLFALAPLLLASALFSGQIGYGQLFSYGPPQIALWSFAAAMIALRRHLTHERLMMLAVASGATEAFLDQIISVPLIAGSFLIIAGLVSHHREGTPPVRRAIVGIAMLAFAWMFGFAGSYAMKLLLSVALLGWGPLQEFLQQLAFRAGTVDAEFGYGAEHPASRFAMLWPNILALAGNFWRLGFAGNEDGILNYVALLVGAGGWVAAIRRRAAGLTEDRARALAAGLPYIAAALFLLVWVLAFPEHTMRHSFFMVRSAIVWLIGGWGWLYTAYPPRLRAPVAAATNC
jgi:hypothetical protein